MDNSKMKKKKNNAKVNASYPSISDSQAIILLKWFFLIIGQNSLPNDSCKHCNNTFNNIMSNDNAEFEDFSTKIWEFVHTFNVLVFELVY